MTALSRLALWLDPANRRRALRAEIRDQVAARCRAEAEVNNMRHELLSVCADLEARVRGERLRDQAREIIDSAAHRFSRTQRAGLLVELPLTADGNLDEAAFASRVFDAAIAHRTIDSGAQR